MLQKKIRLLCITCPGTDICYEEQVELACLGGADMIQFRDEQMSDKDMFNMSLKLQQICNKYDVSLIPLSFFLFLLAHSVL